MPGQVVAANGIKRLIPGRQHLTGRRVDHTGVPVDPARYDYDQAARDALTFAALFDRFIQNLRRYLGTDVQRGYTLVIWRGRHVNEPTELDEAEAAGYWAEVLAVARALISVYEPLKMNYETLGNSLPHLHTHLVPRYTDDPRPGQPFPLSAQAPDEKIPDDRLLAEAAELRSLLR